MDVFSKIRIVKAFLPTPQFGLRACGVWWATIGVGACLLDQPVCAQEGKSSLVTIAVNPLFHNAVRTPPPMDGEPERFPPQGNNSFPRNPEGNVQTFLPPQIPIGLLSIDTRTKPKGDNNIVPVDLNRKAFGEPLTVQAAQSTEANTVWAPVPTPDSMNFPYQPLYFEEPNLERYGRSSGHLQPVLSGMRFFATIPALPYAMTVHRPNRLYLWRWPYEAGWGAPRVRELPPLDAKASLVQASLLTGLIFVVP
jgi:hypothetical protein